MNETYRNIEKIGSGGMAEVWLVETSTGQQYAMKKCHQKNRKSYYEAALRKEAELLAGLHHPMIPSLIEYDPDGSFVMDYIKGESLEHFLNKEVSKKQIKHWMKEVSEILSYLHQHGIFYLDLKPQNLICDEQGHLHLIDFGVSVNAGNPSVYAITPRLWCS